MTDTDITLSENLTQPQSWLRDNRLFLIITMLLSLLSLGMLIHNRWLARPMPVVSPPPPAPAPTPPKVSRPVKKDPLLPAQRYFQQGNCDEAIFLLLDLAKNAPDPALRERASTLAKTYHLIQQEKIALKRTYLQGYVLFPTYPQQACQMWKRSLTQSIHPENRSDEYYLKTKERWNQECLIY